MRVGASISRCGGAFPWAEFAEVALRNDGRTPRGLGLAGTPGRRPASRSKPKDLPSAVRGLDFVPFDPADVEGALIHGAQGVPSLPVLPPARGMPH